ncbi:MAG: glutathione S-transferase family protein [Pseudomonadota bacterium]
MTDITLYGYCTSPFVRKAACCLWLKDLAFKHVPVSPINPAETIGFTGQTQVPVVQIGEDWRHDSTPIALWLDEVFPAAPRLAPTEPEARARIMEIEAWASGTFLPAMFRPAMEPIATLDQRFRFWRLAQLVDSQTPLPAAVRQAWPDFVPNAPFIKAMAETMDLTESASAMAMRVGLELADHIGDGPFIGGAAEPGLVDAAVFPNLVFGFMAGLEDRLSAAAHPVIAGWLSRMAARLPDNPTLVTDDFLVRRLSDAGLAPAK